MMMMMMMMMMNARYETAGFDCQLLTKLRTKIQEIQLSGRHWDKK